MKHSNANRVSVPSIVAIWLAAFVWMAGVGVASAAAFSFDEVTDPGLSPVSGRLVITDQAHQLTVFSEADITDYKFSVNGYGELNPTNSTIEVSGLAGLGIAHSREIRSGLIRVTWIPPVNKVPGKIYPSNLSLYFNRLGVAWDSWSLVWRKWTEDEETGDLLLSTGSVDGTGDWFLTATDPCASIDVIANRINIQLADNPGAQGIEAKLSPKYGCTLSEVAMALGYHHFNWHNELLVDSEKDRDPGAPRPTVSGASSGTFPDRPLTDPPIGGWSYHSGPRLCNRPHPSMDPYPWYWNDIEYCEIRQIEYSNGFETVGILDLEDWTDRDHFLTFVDFPAGFAGGDYLEFQTALVGIYMDDGPEHPDHSGVAFSKDGLSFKWRVNCPLPVGQRCNGASNTEIVFSNTLPVFGAGVEIELLGLVDNKDVAAGYRAAFEEYGIPVIGSQFSEVGSTFGPETLTLDHETGLQWLDLGETVNMSFDEVSQEMAGGMFDGYRHATTDEVMALFAQAGFVPGSWSQINYDAFNLLVSFIGISFEITDFSAMQGVTGTTSGSGSTLVVPIVSAYREDRPDHTTFQKGSVNATEAIFPPDSKSIEFGHWLVAGSPDEDDDGVSDSVDNCTHSANANQRDSDGDGYGNLCDADLNNDGFVTAADYLILRSKLNTDDADADLNGDGFVTAADYLILRSKLNQPPGPSGIMP